MLVPEPLLPIETNRSSPNAEHAGRPCSGLLPLRRLVRDAIDYAVPEMPGPSALAQAQSMARQIRPEQPRLPRNVKKEVIIMTVSIPLVLIAGVVVYLAWRYMGLKVWHAIVCLILGFVLASTGAAPQINSLISGIVHQAQLWLSGGKG